MRSSVVAIATALLLGATSGCSVFEHDAPAVAHGIGDAIAGAAHDHVTVKVPDLPKPIDLGDLPVSSLREQVHSIFGDETKENVEIVCKAKELAAQHVTDTSEDAIRQVLDTLNIQRPDVEIEHLAQETERAVESGLSPNELTRAAVAWSCQWAAS